MLIIKSQSGFSISLQVAFLTCSLNLMLNRDLDSFSCSVSECILSIDLFARDLKLFRKLVILRGLSTTFCEMAHIINQSLVSLFEVQADYTCWKDSSLKFL